VLQQLLNHPTGSKKNRKNIIFWSFFLFSSLSLHFVAIKLQSSQSLKALSAAAPHPDVRNITTYALHYDKYCATPFIYFFKPFFNQVGT